MNNRFYFLFLCGLVTIGLFAKNTSTESFFNDSFIEISNHEEKTDNLFELIDVYNQNPQKKKEFHFSDGTIGYLVSDDNKLYGVTDATGKIIVPQKYGKITCYGDLLYCKESSVGKKYSCALYYKDGECKVSESDGYTILNFVLSKGKLIATSNSPMAVFDDKGDYIYKYKQYKDSNGFVYLKNELADTIVVNLGKYTDYFTLQRDIIHMWIGNKTGIMELNGTVVIPAIKYGSITPSRNGFWVKLSKFGDGVTGYLDRNGKCIIPAVNYTEVYPLDNGVFEIIANGKASIVDSLGNILISTKYSGIHPVKDNDGSWYYETYLGNGKGKMSLQGNVITEPQPTTQRKEIVKNGFSYIEILDKNGMCGIINSFGKQIIPCNYKMIMYDKDLPGFKLFKNGFQGIADLNGNIIIPCDKYHDITKVKRKGLPLFFRVDYLGKYGLCDSIGQELIKPQFDDIDPYMNETAIVQIGLLRGLIDFAGNVIIPLEYSKIYSLNDGTYDVRSFNKRGICDNKGHIIIPPKYTEIKKISIKGEEFSQLYKVKDGETVGLFTTQGKMIFPTGLFKNVSLYKKGEVLSTDPVDGVHAGLMGMLKSVGGSGSSIDESKFSDVYIKAFNDFKEGIFYFYDLRGNLICDTRQEKAFDKYFDSGQEEFNNKNYKKAIECYKQALAIKQDGVTFYNIGAAYYNIDKYKDAIKNLQACIRLKPRQSVIDDARDLILDCEKMLQQKRERRANIIMGIFGSALNVASIVIQTNAAIKSYNSTSSNYNLPPSLNPQLFAQNAMVQVNAQMAMQKNQFLTQFRNNFRKTMGREPSEMEEMEAYTQFLQSMNATYNNQSSSSSFDSSDSSDYTNNNTSSNSTPQTKKCGLCNGTGKIDDSVANFGITDKKWCSECGEYRINGHYHKTCPSCKGKGYR